MAKQTTTKSRATKTTKKAPRKTSAAAKSRSTTKSKVATKKAPAKVSVSANKQQSRLSAVFRRSRKDTEQAVTADSLNNWNKWLALLYLVQGGVIVLLSKTALFGITATFLAKDTLLSKADGSTVLSSATQHLFDINLAYLLAALLFVLAIVHGSAALWYRGRYEAGLLVAASPLRWVGAAFGVGGSLMLVALVSGVQDIVSLGMVIVLTVIAVVMGLALELLNRDRKLLSGMLYRIYFMTYFAIWLIIGAYLVFAGIYDGNIPTYVYYLFVSAVVLSFALTNAVRLQQIGAGKWANYFYAERTFYLISFVLVTATAWQLYAGQLT